MLDGEEVPMNDSVGEGRVEQGGTDESSVGSPGAAPAPEGPGRAGLGVTTGSEKIGGFDPGDKDQPAEGGVEQAEDGAGVGEGRQS